MGDLLHGPTHDAEECEDRPCDWHIALSLAADVKRLTAELAEQRACHDMDVRSMLRMQGTVSALTAEVRTCTEVARIAQYHADKFKADRDAAIEHLAAANAEIDRLKAANANLIRNAEILADEIVLGTTATFGTSSIVSPMVEWWEDKP
jgi:hypothetical protein